VALAGLRVLIRPFVWVANARGRTRFVLLFAECLVAAALGAGVWRALSLRELPDPGHPFDMAAFRAGAIPAESNFYVLYAQAAAAYTNQKRPSKVIPNGFAPAKVHPDDPEVGAWLEANAEALGLFYRAADRPDARPVTQAGSGEGRAYPADRWQALRNVRELSWMAVEDGARAQARGDLEGAWRSFRASLRASALIARRGGMMERHVAATLRNDADRAVAAWAADPRNTPALLRTALGDVLALEALAPDDVFTLRDEYLRVGLALERSEGLVGRVPQVQVGDMMLPDTLVRAYYASYGFLYREPERSRRVARLAFANWLAWAALPPGGRPRPAVKAVLRGGFQSQRVDFFTFPPGAAPPAARALAPGDLAAAFVDARVAQETAAPAWVWLRSVRNKEARDRSGLVLRLAGALYRLERGAPPPQPEALVGPYLPALPDDGSSDLDDGNTPEVDTP
jgi:hypothetical protein